MASGILAMIIFAAMFVLIVIDKIERHIVTLACGLLTLVFVFGVAMHDGQAVLNTLNFKSIATVDFWYQAGEAHEESSGINWATIIFIAGMMIMVEGMAKAGFFRWLCMKIAKLVRFKPIPIFVTFMILSAVLAMFIDSITVILFLAAVTIELAQMLKFNPVPVILTEIFCANLGGSATMCGDPPNIIIGTSLGYSFADFVTNTGLIAGISLIVVVIYFFLTVRKDVIPADRNEADIKVDTEIVIENKVSFIVSCVIFLAAIIMLVTHAMTGLTVAFIGVTVAAATLIAAGKDIPELLKKVDYKTLLFFIGLFIVVGGLEETGILEVLADFIERITGGNAMIMIAVILWLSAVAS
ncbi:MAG: SLC13 family permease, partial [Oscillospiraceae bacterium]